MAISSNGEASFLPKRKMKFQLEQKNVAIPSNGEASFLRKKRKRLMKYMVCSNSLKRGSFISTVYSHKPLNSSLSKPILARNFLNILIFAYLWAFLWLFKNCISIHTIQSLDMALFIRLGVLHQWQFPQSGNLHFYVNLNMYKKYRQHVQQFPRTDGFYFYK